MSHRRNKGRRLRRRRQRGTMLPAEAVALSTRTRWREWPVTRAVTRFHRRRRYWRKDWRGDEEMD